MSFWDRYNERVTLQHGWDVELTCAKCGHVGIPKYDGWQSKHSIAFGRTAVVYALVSCPDCGRSLESEAAEWLVETFPPVRTHPACRRLLIGFVLVFVLATVYTITVATTDFYTGFPALLLLMPLIPVLNYRIASLRFRCACGRPRYIFMGLLGRSYCHRCSTCGRLLRLRD